MKPKHLPSIIAIVALAICCLQADNISAKNALPEVRYIGTIPCTESPPPGEKGVRLFKLCDGETKVIIAAKGVEPGRPMPRQIAQMVASTLMTAYEDLKVSKLLAHKGVPHTPREQRTWESELKKMIQKGYELFHSPELSTNGISCDMCHPDAANTHPETYPKFQTQLKKVALLRDMINWCIENPQEGKKLADDDERMKALEAYILSTRKGIPLEFGKH